MESRSQLQMIRLLQRWKMLSSQCLVPFNQERFSWTYCQFVSFLHISFLRSYLDISSRSGVHLEECSQSSEPEACQCIGYGFAIYFDGQLLHNIGIRFRAVVVDERRSVPNEGKRQNFIFISIQAKILMIL